jgi:hypothetical protein
MRIRERKLDLQRIQHAHKKWQHYLIVMNLDLEPSCANLTPSSLYDPCSRLFSRFQITSVCWGRAHSRHSYFGECLACKALGELFAECDSRQMSLGELYIGNGFFFEYFFCWTLGKAFAECHLILINEKSSSRRQVMVTEPLPSVCWTNTLQREHQWAPLSGPLPKALECSFVECLGHNTRQRRFTGSKMCLLCRVLWSWCLFTECYT